MALKKQNFAEGEIAIFDEACVYKRGECWQFRLWLPKENKYARKSLRTRSSNCYQTYYAPKTVTPSTKQLTSVWKMLINARLSAVYNFV